MRLRVDDISFESPRGLEDRSAYDFDAAEPKLQIELRLEFPAGGGTPSGEVIAELHQQLDGFPVPGFSIDPLDPLNPLIIRDVAGVPGNQLRYSFDERGQTMQGVIVVANLGSEANASDWVKLSWMLAMPRAEADAHVDAVLASLAPADQPAPAASAPGWIRRRAGAWAFDVPAHASYPRVHAWCDLDAQLSIEITITELDAEPPVLDEPLIDAADKGLIVVDREDIPLANGQLMRVRLRDDELGDERLVCRAVERHGFGDPVRTCYVQVDAAAPWAAADRLRALVDELLASVREEQRP
jgi:hypothetical protein